MTEDEAKTGQNTDKHLWPTISADPSLPSIHVTAQGGIGINVGGYVIVKPLEDWHGQDARIATLEAENKELREALKPFKLLYDEIKALQAANPDMPQGDDLDGWSKSCLGEDLRRAAKALKGEK